MTIEIPVLDGCESLSHAAGGATGVVVVHGFTGNPSSVRGVADAMIAAGFDVELPRLPGHGTTVDDMLGTRWADWSAELDRARCRVAERVDHVVLVGQSMGATLALASAIEQPDVRGLVCINPATRLRDADVMAMLDEFIEDGLTIVPGEGSDIADPEAFDNSYDGTPLAPLHSLLHDGIAPITGRFGELTVPLRLFTSRQDHVVDPADSEHLAAAYGGPVEHTWLERSFHVAALDYDRATVIEDSVEFVRQVTAT
ncbi:MAG: alpha/beta fold hydrolase [Ilumatobacter sp.]|uniref:alpha/beta hydrolase n=1 Tax=Ilumatobacter sp. TaxID=1967498 RepID=UPI00262B607C|nr:alpha/beta fold hydrolase [Ilumatobacter sp.]MDJ0771693.1 alpha/beta fold hydrolase [Ilumatobacter sp.]